METAGRWTYLISAFKFSFKVVVATTLSCYVLCYYTVESLGGLAHLEKQLSICRLMHIAVLWVRCFFAVCRKYVQYNKSKPELKQSFEQFVTQTLQLFLLSVTIDSTFRHQNSLIFQ